MSLSSSARSSNRFEHGQVRVVRLFPGLDPDVRADAGARRSELEAGHEQHGLERRPAERQARQPLERHRPIAGQVLQIGTDAHDRSVETLADEQVAERVQASNVELGGNNGPIGGGRAHDAAALGGGAVASSQRPIVAGPSSNSFR